MYATYWVGYYSENNHIMYKVVEKSVEQPLVLFWNLSKKNADEIVGRLNKAKDTGEFKVQGLIAVCGNVYTSDWIIKIENAPLSPELQVSTLGRGIFYMVDAKSRREIWNMPPLTRDW